MKGYTVIELKTTGNNPILDKICYISISNFSLELKLRSTYTTWINPEALLTKGMSKFLGVTSSDLLKFPKFSEVFSIVDSYLVGNNLVSFNKNIDIIEFLKEAYYDEDKKFRYEKKDFIIIQNLEEHINKRDLNTLYYKYTGNNSTIQDTEKVGEILKYQCEILGEDLKDFNYSTFIKNDTTNYLDKYLIEKDSKLYLNFGKFTGKDIKDTQESYIEWVLENDFPTSVKEKIKNYIK